MSPNLVKMGLPLFCVFLLSLISAVAMYLQNDYKLHYERVEVFRQNPDYLKNVKTANFKYNRTTVASNYSSIVLVDFGNGLMVQVQGYKMASNEYRLFPIVFEFNFCSAIAKDEFGLKRFYRCGHFARCPIVKGAYTFCNFVPDESKFPPYVPEGSYRFDLKFTYLSAEVQYLQFFASVNRPIKIPS